MLKQHRDPRAKKVKNSSRIRNIQDYKDPRRLRHPLLESLGVDESGFRVFIKTLDYGETKYNYTMRHHYQVVKNRANGRSFYQGRHKQNTGKNSRVAMREKSQWRDEAIEALVLRPESSILEWCGWEETDWKQYLTPEQQTEMEAYNELMDVHDEAFDDISVYNDEINEKTWPIGVQTFSRVFQCDVILDERLDFVEANTGRVLLPYPILGEAREQRWLMRLEKEQAEMNQAVDIWLRK